MTMKAHRFPVSVHWQEGHLTRASAPDKPDLQIATPPEFKGGIAGVWSPEDLLVASTAACYAVTLAAVAELWDLTLHGLEVDGTGHVELRDDGRFGFVAIELRATLEVDSKEVDAAQKAAARAERLCLISLALDTPVHVDVNVRSLTGRHETAAA
jgi:peroxiredoxin-like protein